MDANVTCALSADNTFGPQVHGCRNGFDFTLLFEQSICSIGPSALFLFVSPFRALQLQHTEIKTRKVPMRFVKLAAIGVFGCLQLATLTYWSSNPTIRTRASIPAAILGLLDAFALAMLSNLEEKKSIRPSSIINVYLVFSILFDAVQTRTLWLRQDSEAIAALVTATVCVKCIMLFLEASDKRAYLFWPFQGQPPEATSSILNRSFFFWINTLFIQGFASVLSAEQLFKVDDALLSSSLHDNLRYEWDRMGRKSTHRLISATASTLIVPLLLSIFPRLCLTGFNFSQPLLINRMINYLTDPSVPESKDIGYGLIGATALIYIGIAISTGYYKHSTYRMITMTRGALVALIYTKTTNLSAFVVDDAAAVSLMSTDVETICEGLVDIHEIWASPLEISLSLYLLWTQVGYAGFSPLILAIICFVISLQISKMSASRRVTWNRAIQKRVGTTASMLGSMKGVKILGLTDVFTQKLQNLRVAEIALCKIYFKLISISEVIGFCVPTYGSPVITFVIFTVTQSAGGPTVAQAFTSLSLIQLLSSPLSTVLSYLPSIAGVVACFGRIQKFLFSEEREDSRIILSNEGTRIIASDVETHTIDIELADMSFRNISFDIENADFGYLATAEPILKNITLKIPPASLTIIIGPVGCGKTTFLRCLLGESFQKSGKLRIATSKIAYCGQEAWLVNKTLRNNIAFEGDFDKKWYNTVVAACGLDRDFGLLPQGDLSVLGSKGISLSGGQKQRVALARAVYSRSPIILLDDVMSGFDARTDNDVFNRLFGRDGLCRKLESTVVFAMHGLHHLRSADRVIVLGSDGRVTKEGPTDRINFTHADVREVMPTDDADKGESTNTKAGDEDQVHAVTATLTEPIDAVRRTGDVSVYKFYYNHLGGRNVLVSLLLLTSVIFCGLFQQIWLKWWTEDPNSGSGGVDAKYLSVYGLLNVLATVIDGIAVYFLFVKMIPRCSTTMHSILLSAFMNASYQFSVATDAGVTLNRFSQDMTLIDSTLSQALVQTCVAAMTCVGGLILIAIGSTYMAAVIPVLLIILYGVQNFYLRTSRQLRFMDIEAKSPLYTNFLETLDGLMCIRGYGWGDNSKARNLELLDISQRPYYLLFCIQRWLNLVLDLIVAGLALLLVTLAIELKDTTSGGAIGVALFNILSFNQQLTRLLTYWTQLETSLGAIARVKTFTESTESEHKLRESNSVVRHWPDQGKIRFCEVTASYDDQSKAVLRNVSLIVEQGQRIGICGRSGSGKSSLVLTLLRLLDFSFGTIVVDDVDLTTVARQIVRSHINVIPQDSYLFSGSVRFNLAFETDLNDEALIEALAKVGLWEKVADRGGLDAEMDSVPLSQGQRQLMCLARALLRDSSVLVLDEATSNVDHETDALMQRLFREEFLGCTILAVAHRLETIVDFDRIAVIEKGQLIEFDTPSALLAKPTVFREMYTKQHPQAQLLRP